MKEAAKFFLDHPEYFNRLEMSAGWAHKDGVVGMPDINKEIAQVNADIRRYGLPPSREAERPSPVRPPPGEAAPTDPVSPKPPEDSKTPSPISGEIGKILGDQSLSIEEKIMLILSMVVDKVDEELEKVAGQIGDVSDERSAAAGEKVDQKDGEATKKQDDKIRKLDTAMEKMQLRMQTLMEKRKQMFELMSNMSTKFHEMSKTAIQNLARA